MDPMLLGVHRILEKGLNTNSYKFALCRALVKTAGQASMSIDQLAESFVAQYWPLEVQFHLRQSIDPAKDPIVMRRIRALADGHGAHTLTTWQKFREKNRDEASDLIEFVARKAFGDVLPRFHTVQGETSSSVLYVQGKDEIRITGGGLAVLQGYGPVIDKLAVASWVRFTERYTAAPRLFEKLAGTPPTRGPLTSWVTVLRKSQDSLCFYCDTPLSGAVHVDHCIPWSFVLEDRVWNLVLACAPCNSVKSDRIPPTKYIDKLAARNRAGDFASEARVGRVLVEWASRGLDDHIRGLHRSAAADGYPAWSGPKAA